MTLIRSAVAACVVGALMALPSIAAAQGQTRNQDTYFTFSQPVELPNVTLPAGTYLFRLVDNASNRHIVRVTSEDRSKLYTTLMAIPSYSTSRPPDEPEVRFMETPAGGPNAIKIWFYPGNSVGHEFIYPRSQALKIAARTNQPVLTTKTESEVTAESELTRVNETGVDTAVDTSNRSTTTAQQTTTAQAQPTTATPTEAQRETSTQASAQTQAQTEQTRTTQQPMTRQTDTRTTDTTARTQSEAPATDRADVNRDTRRTELPNTAGVLPLLAVIGIGSLVGSRLLRRTRRV
jgi:hypothetical protein